MNENTESLRNRLKSLKKNFRYDYVSSSTCEKSSGDSISFDKGTYVKDTDRSLERETRKIGRKNSDRICLTKYYLIKPFKEFFNDSNEIDCCKVLTLVFLILSILFVYSCIVISCSNNFKYQNILIFI